MERSKNSVEPRPIVAWTLGDVAGIGPELALKAWIDPQIHKNCRPIVVGSPEVLKSTAQQIAIPLNIHPFQPDSLLQAADAAAPDTLVCINPSSEDVATLAPGQVHGPAGKAAYDYLVAATDWAIQGQIAAIVTLPLNKEGLHAAGLPYPGHTEILAERTGVTQFGMMLYRKGLGVLHLTLHMALRRAIDELTTDAITAKIALLDQMMRRLGVRKPRLAVAALNPHASDGGLFGNEEREINLPAVECAQEAGHFVHGPLPADTLFVRAAQGEFDGVLAMYHDQGHIALKLLGWREAVNITVGLPIIRTSVAHGTGYDIVGKGTADPASLKEALRAALLLIDSSRTVDLSGSSLAAAGDTRTRLVQ